MHRLIQPGALFLLSGALVLSSTACSLLGAKSTVGSEDAQAASVPSDNPSPPASVPSQSPIAPSPISEPSASPQPDPYDLGIERASSAVTVSQSAQSRDDWRLAANRWQQAVDFMVSVPTSHRNYAQAQRKLEEYRRNLTYATQQADRPLSSEARGSITVNPGAAPMPAPPSTTPVSMAPPPVSSSAAVFQVPIIRREAGTPVIEVVFNGSQSFPMIVDTGASSTLITQSMAYSLGVVPTGQTRVDTASASGVTFLLGQVQSMQVNGIVVNNVRVTIAGPELQTGLLGHDFFGGYDVTIRQDVVEFHPR